MKSNNSSKKLSSSSNSNAQSNFSTQNKFDYPLISQYERGKSKNSMSPKHDSLALLYQKKQKQNEQNIRKAKYYCTMRQEHHNERDKVKSKQQKLQKMEEQKKKQEIKQKLQAKKKQLQQLQAKRQQAIRQHGVAQEKARKLAQQLEVKRLKSQQTSKLNASRQKQRFGVALVKIKSDKELNPFFVKRSQSIKRNQTRNLYKSRQRQDAEQYSKEKQVYDKEVQQRKKQSQLNQQREQFTKRMEQKTGKSVDFSSSCYHNFAQNVIILQEKVPKNVAKQTSNEKAEKYEALLSERKSIKNQQQELNRQKSAQRGREALRKLKQAKQYNKYLQEMEQEQLNYNLGRIQEGKKNQFIGLKPETLKTQMRDKQIRSEEEFQKMFFTPTKNNEKNAEKGDKFKNQIKTAYYQNQRQDNKYRYNNTASTERSDRSASKKYVMTSDYKRLQDEGYSKNIYTIPQNSKIQALLYEKSLPSYRKNLFSDRTYQQPEQCQQIFNFGQRRQKKSQYEDYIKMAEKDIFSYENQGMTLDYSMTDNEESVA